MKSLKPRLLTAAIGIPVVILVIIFSELWHPFLRIAVGIVTAIMVGEYLYGKKLIRFYPLSIVCIAFSFLMSLLIVTNLFYLLIFAFFTAVFLVIIINHERLSYSDIAYAVTGTLLISFGTSAISYACSNEISVTFYFFLIFLLPWMADAGGYFVGASLGKTKLCPKISPKKTVEGAIGGILFCLISAVAMGLVFQLFVMRDVSINFYSLIIAGVLDAVLSIIGDLSFSLIKRSLGIKDYGTIFPGHGGMLDRFDSIIFTAPVIVIIGQFLPFLTLG